MAKIIIIGTGVMGTSIAVPALDNDHELILVGSPLDDAIIETMRDGGTHPKLDRPLIGAVTSLRHDELHVDQIRGADIVVLGVGSAGIPWSLDYLLSFGVTDRAVDYDHQGPGRDGGRRRAHPLGPRH